jgi:hypothetical protein
MPSDRSPADQFKRMTILFLRMEAFSWRELCIAASYLLSN